VRSAGMICAEDELGLSDDHSGIMVLDPQAPVGVPVFDLLNLGDPILDFEITPNRPDCLSAVGIARELCVLAGRDFNFRPTGPAEIAAPAADYVRVIINDPDGCPRYAARIIENVTLGSSPWWMRKRLMGCGVRPINTIVDITNYVMLETGHPLHAFDYHRFGSREVIVRRARPREKFTTLDGNEHDLDETVLLITNGLAGVAAAGVMGGLESEVRPETKTVLLEAAYFDPKVIRRSSRRLGMASESSYRFERGIDPNGVVHAADRAAALMAELAGGQVAAGVVDNYARKITPITVTVRPTRINKLLGVDVPVAFVENTFRRLGIAVAGGETYTATVPTFRPDITREADLIEEIARIFGLENIPTATQNAGPLYTPVHRSDTIKNELRRIMTGFGFEETLGSGMAHAERLVAIDPAVEPIKVLNPLSDEFAVMRTRLLYSLLVSCGNNIRHRNLDVKIFEIGKLYLRVPGGGETPVFPSEPEYFGFLVTGRPDEVFWRQPDQKGVDFYEAKGVLTGLIAALGLGDVTLQPAAVSGYDPAVCFTILKDGNSLGSIGRVHQRISRLFDIKQDAYAAEIDLGVLVARGRQSKPFEPLPRYPASLRDIAVIVDREVPAAVLRDEIVAAGGRLVEAVAIFDVFVGSPVPEGKKSLAFSISFRSPDKTLEDQEVDQIYNRVVSHLETRFNARLRE
jgi:phenylalanyl-tRNA synthetase beta chain